MRRAIGALFLLLAPASAAAQAFDGTQGVDTFSGPVIAPGRILGLGGAYVAVAEGLGGVTVNPAAVAQRSRRLSRGWDWDGFLTWYLPAAAELGRQDVGNDGRADASLSGIANAQGGLSASLGRLGVGLLARSWALSAPRDGVGTAYVEIAEGSLALGWSALRDALVVGASVTAVSGVVRVEPALPSAPDRVVYSGRTLRFGALLRPRGRPYRLGAALDPGAIATGDEERAALPLATPARFVAPWVLSLGIARWIGPNASRMNEPPPIALEQHPEWGPGPAWRDAPRRPVLIAVQLDLVGPAPGAVTVESALVESGRASPSGEKGNAVLRAGAEWEPVPERLRARGGGYLEPSRTGGAARPHATFGVDVRVPFLWRDLQLGLSGDLAARFQNVSLSLGFWSSLGPQPPPDAAVATR